ncbi:MAG: PilZ domain-containing protein [Lachnospiraceae bacterium]|nr:PilZ domain-containing protein [Lachnospiraceae bacterium]
MNDRRKSKRIELEAKLFVKRLDKQEAQEINIDVFDISTSGIGFNCNEALTIGAVYDTDLTLWNKDIIHTFIEIVRISKTDSTFQYGGIFIGMPEMDVKRIEIYDTINTYSKDGAKE